MWKFFAVMAIAAFATAFFDNDTAEASAPRAASQQAGLVLKKLDTLIPPNYPADFWRDRDQLSRDIEAVLRLMLDPVATGGWCEGEGVVLGIIDILNLATLTNSYFDIGLSNNPALDEFKKDWLRVAQVAGCLPHGHLTWPPE